MTATATPAPARFSHFFLLNDFPPPSRSLEKARKSQSKKINLDFQKSPSSDLIWRGTTSRNFVARVASQPKKLALLAKKLVRSTCGKSKVNPSSPDSDQQGNVWRPVWRIYMWILGLKGLGPRPQVSVLFKNGDFFLRFGPRSTRIRWRRSPKTHVFKRSPVWRFLKTPVYCFRVDGRKRRFLNTMINVIH